MNPAALGLAAALLLAQSLPPDTVALILGPEPTRVEIITVVEAEKEYSRLSKQASLTEEEDRRLVALVDALGSHSGGVQVPGLPGSRERLDWEIRRGVRRPAQSLKRASGVAL